MSNVSSPRGPLTLQGRRTGGFNIHDADNRLVGELGVCEDVASRWLAAINIAHTPGVENDAIPAELLEAGDPELDRLVSVAATLLATGDFGGYESTAEAAAHLIDACRDYRQRQTDDVPSDDAETRDGAR